MQGKGRRKHLLQLLRVGGRFVEVDGGRGDRGRRRVVVARWRLDVTLADVLVHVTVELASNCVAATRRGRHHVVQRNGLGRMMVKLMVTSRDGGGGCRVHGHRGVGPVMVVQRPAARVHLRPVPFPAVRVLTHATLHRHQECAYRQHQTADVQEPRVSRRHHRGHDQQETYCDPGEVEHL